MSSDRAYFAVQPSANIMDKPGHNAQWWRIVSVAGRDVVASGIPSKDLAEAMCEGANNASSKKK